MSTRAALVVAALAGCGDNLVEPAPVQSGSRLRLVAYELEDGTRTFDRRVIHDRERREDCTIELFASGERHCMPVTAGGHTVFTESTCTHAVGAIASNEPPPRYFIRRFLLRGVELPSRIYPAGERIAAPAFTWRQQDSFCLGPIEVDPTLAFYELGDVITDAELARVRADETLHGERLALTVDASDDGWRMPGALHDKQLDMACRLLPAANAEVATCVPYDLAETTYFADTACTQPLLLAQTMLHQLRDEGCLAVVTAGDAYDGDVFQRIGENCISVPPPGGLLRQAASSVPVATVPRVRGTSSDPGIGTVTGTRLAPTLLSGLAAPDGYLYDAELDADCAITDAGDGLACVPHQPLVVRPYFRDDACSEPIDVVFVPTGRCQPRFPYAGGRRIEPAPYAGTLYEPTTGDRCAAYAPPPRFEVHALGERAPLPVPAARVID